MKEKFTTLNTEILNDNGYWLYKHDKYIMPNGETGDFYYVNSRGATLIIPHTKRNTYILIRQYRYINKKFSLEFPGGGVKPNTGRLQNAREELKEETGMSAEKISLIGEYNPYNGVTDEICSIYYAEGLEAGETRFDDSEEIENVELTAGEIEENIRANEIWDGMTLAAWMLYKCSDFYIENKEC